MRLNALIATMTFLLLIPFSCLGEESSYEKKQIVLLVDPGISPKQRKEEIFPVIRELLRSLYEKDLRRPQTPVVGSVTIYTLTADAWKKPPIAKLKLCPIRRPSDGARFIQILNQLEEKFRHCLSENEWIIHQNIIDNLLASGNIDKDTEIVFLTNMMELNPEYHFLPDDKTRPRAAKDAFDACRDLRAIAALHGSQFDQHVLHFVRLKVNQDECSAETEVEVKEFWQSLTEELGAEFAYYDSVGGFAKMRQERNGSSRSR
ncbi:hypothetical protein ACFLU6_16560 [Acidobacteriota bacterium]